jgi:hypothetical protein
MTQTRFHPILIFLLTAFFLFGTFFVSASAVVLAQQPTDTPASSTGMFITVLYDEPQINVRLGPNSSIYPVVGTLLAGSTAPALGRSQGGDWIQIEFPSAPGGRGWVYSPLVQVSPGALQIAEPPPTPVPPPTATIDPTLAAQFSIVPTNTRLPTFTPPPSFTPHAYTEIPIKNPDDSVPLAVIISAFAILGLMGFLLSLIRR